MTDTNTGKRLQLFSSAHRPSARKLAEVLRSLGDRYQVSAPETSIDGDFDALTVYCPDDRAAIDVSFVDGEEVQEQIDELLEDFHQVTLSSQDQSKPEQIRRCDARLDLFHFEERGDDEDEEDPGRPRALLVVLEPSRQVDGWSRQILRVLPA
ncbi:MAG: hypothetical protein R3B96_22175 [Pirellulaceae bacterium]